MAQDPENTEPSDAPVTSPVKSPGAPEDAGAGRDVPGPFVAARRRWRKTFGERLLRILGLVAAVAALALTWIYAIAPERPGPPRDSTTGQQAERQAGGPRAACWTPGPAPAAVNVLVVAADVDGLGLAQVEALREAVASYFSASARLVPAGGYQAGQLDAAEAVLVVGNGPFVDPAPMTALLADIAARDLPVLWMGLGAYDFADALGLRFADAYPAAQPARGDAMLDYRGVRFPAGGLMLDRGTLLPPAAPGRVAATIELPDGQSRPAAIVRGKLAYASFLPFQGLEPSLALAATVDMLSGLIGTHAPDPRLLLRLEDISGQIYGAGDTSFASTTGYLLREGVFMHLSLIAKWMDAQGNFIAGIDAAAPVRALVSEHPDAVEIVQHGSQHFRPDPRNAGMPTGEAHEFFFDDDETMGPAGARAFAEERLVEGFTALADLGWEPWIFEAPHYVMSPAEQAVAEELYPVMHHPPLFHAGLRSELLLPWFSRRGETMYAPWAAGYVDALDPGSVANMLQVLEQLAGILPDPVAVVQFHPFMREAPGREQDLEALIEGARRLGYRFASTCEELNRTAAAGM